MIDQSANPRLVWLEGLRKHLKIRQSEIQKVERAIEVLEDTGADNDVAIQAARAILAEKTDLNELFK